MHYSVDSITFFYSLRLIGKVTAIWPLETGASPTKKLFHEIKWWITFVSAIALLLPLILGVYYFRNDSIRMMKTLTELTVLVQYSINLILCRINKKTFKVILDNIEYFFVNANEFERNLLEKYTGKYKRFQIFVGLFSVAIAVSFNFLPFLTSQELPADAWYPFSIEPKPIRIFLFFTQGVTVFQVGFDVATEITIAMIFWYSALHIELLNKKIIEAIDYTQLKDCARRHRKLVEFIENAKDGIQFIVLKTNAAMAIAIITGCSQLRRHQPMEVLLRFILLVGGGCVRIYMSASAADDLKEKCENLAQSTFENAISQKSLPAAKLGLMMAARFQKPIILSMNGVIKAYTLQYYTVFLSTTMSYFLSIRAMLE